MDFYIKELDKADYEDIKAKMVSLTDELCKTLKDHNTRLTPMFFFKHYLWIDYLHELSRRTSLTSVKD